MPHEESRTGWPRAAREVTDLEDGRTLTVVLPALNEQETVAGVIESMSGLLGTLVDELLVIDSGSCDRTIERALAAGATVRTREQALPGLPPRAGKGEVLWRSLAVATGDIVAFVDTDLVDPDPGLVPALVAPLLAQPTVRLVKGYYRRPLLAEGSAGGGGRVTELMARPLLTALVPALAEIRQPLGGEYAATRELLASIPFAPGYGVEVGVLLDVWARHGAEAIAQVDLGTRIHRNRPTHELAVMSRQVIATVFGRLGIADSGLGLVQYLPEGAGWRRVPTAVSAADRPPMNTLVPGPAVNPSPRQGGIR